MRDWPRAASNRVGFTGDATRFRVAACGTIAWYASSPNTPQRRWDRRALNLSLPARARCALARCRGALCRRPPRWRREDAGAPTRVRAVVSGRTQELTIPASRICMIVSGHRVSAAVSAMISGCCDSMTQAVGVSPTAAGRRSYTILAVSRTCGRVIPRSASYSRRPRRSKLTTRCSGGFTKVANEIRKEAARSMGRGFPTGR